jgi:phage tail-like protein
MAQVVTKPDNFYQAVGFHFSVTFFGLPKSGGQSGDQGSDLDIRFQSVSGLEASIDTEQVKEGGENRFEHVIPVRRRYSPLVLTRGLLKPADSSLSAWCRTALEDQKVKPIQLVKVALLDEEHNILMYWNLSWVWPRSWKLGELNAERSEVLIETLELNYNRFEFKNS